MFEVKENYVFRGDGEADVTAAMVNVHLNPALVKVEGLEDATHSFQDQSSSNDITESKMSEENGGTEKVGASETLKAPGSDLQSKAAESKVQSEWEIGAQCSAVWSRDGLVYPGRVVWLEGQCCRVKFDGHSGEEEMLLGALRCPDPMEQPQKDRAWRVGSHCRAVYSEDGLTYPAVVSWIQGERCRVKFDGYGNEEELDLAALLAQDELNGPGRAASTRQVTSGERSTYNSSSTWRRRKWEESPGERTGERAGGERERERWISQQEEQPSSHLTSIKEWSRNKAEKDQGDGMRGNFQKEAPERPSSNPLSIFPPMPPPPSSGQRDSLPFLAPPPPLMHTWPPRAEGQEARPGLDLDAAGLSSLLLSWYLCGYHTGCYVGVQQSKTTSKGPTSSSE